MFHVGKKNALLCGAMLVLALSASSNSSAQTTYNHVFNNVREVTGVPWEYPLQGYDIEIVYKNYSTQTYSYALPANGADSTGIGGGGNGGNALSFSFNYGCDDGEEMTVGGTFPLSGAKGGDGFDRQANSNKSGTSGGYGGMGGSVLITGPRVDINATFNLHGGDGGNGGDGSTVWGDNAIATNGGSGGEGNQAGFVAIVYNELEGGVVIHGLGGDGGYGGVGGSTIDDGTVLCGNNALAGDGGRGGEGGARSGLVLCDRNGGAATSLGITLEVGAGAGGNGGNGGSTVVGWDNIGNGSPGDGGDGGDQGGYFSFSTGCGQSQTPTTVSDNSAGAGEKGLGGYSSLATSPSCWNAPYLTGDDGNDGDPFDNNPGNGFEYPVSWSNCSGGGGHEGGS